MVETPLLVVEGLEVSAGRTELVRAVGFSLMAGRCMGLVGASGAGKSLTAAALCGLLGAPLKATGRVAFQGRELDPARPGQWEGLRGRGMLLLMQSSAAALSPTMRVGRQIGEALRAAGRDAATARQEAASALAEVGLESSVLRAWPHELSGGMRQRVQLALALALEPALVVADEPTTGLDPVSQRAVLELLDSMRRDRGTALLLISHDLRVIGRMADSVGVMQRGRLVELGPAYQVLSRPEHPHSRALKASMDALEGCHV